MKREKKIPTFLSAGRIVKKLRTHVQVLATYSTISFSIREIFMDNFVVLTELQKKLLHTLYHKKTRKVLFSHEKATQKFLCTKKRKQNFYLHVA